VQVELAFGQSGLAIEAPDDAVVVRPASIPGLERGEDMVRESLRKPFSGPPLGSLVRPGDRVVIAFPDITRPMPNKTVLPPLLAELEAIGVPPRDIELIAATGTHRPATEDELREFVGDAIVARYTVRNHVATDGEHVPIGQVDGAEVLIDPAYVNADVRIVTGFVEPHFFAGFSGGPKAVCPGLAALETILEAHSPARIASEHATWLETEGNPVHDFVRAATGLLPPTFSIDVVINDRGQLVDVFAGELRACHRAACRHVQETVVQRVPGRFDVVVSTNGGYPLDRNLYQAVKGMAAAERVVDEGGAILVAAECRDGIPDEGDFGRILASASSPAELVDATAPAQLDRWQAQVLGRVLQRAPVEIFAPGLTSEQARGAHLEPVEDFGRAVGEALAAHGPQARMCVLPFGPLTVADPA
jgi:nickel-dependent lactate racemase